MYFFLDSGDGNEFETEIMEGENLQGWLVPKSQAATFAQLWEMGEEDDSWVDFYCWAEWCNINGKICVQFTGV